MLLSIVILGVSLTSCSGLAVRSAAQSFSRSAGLGRATDDRYDYQAVVEAAAVARQATFTQTDAIRPHQKRPVPTETIELLKTFRVCGECQGTIPLRRIGDPLSGEAPPPFIDEAGNHKNDGGYLMCPNSIRDDSVALSIGINGWDGWGIHISDEFGVPVQQYDCTNSNVPKCTSDRRCNMTFHDSCVDDGLGSRIGNGKSKTLAQMVSEHAPAKSDNLILKIDCEGCEWGVFKSADEALLSRFGTIVCEFHYLGDNSPGVHQYKLGVMQMLLKHFVVVHTHECNFVGYPQFGPYRVPDIMEVTLVRKDLVDPVKCQSSPTYSALDMPDKLEKPDLGSKSTILPMD